MRARRIARAHFERRERHERHVRRGGRDEAFDAERRGRPDQRVFGRDGRSADARRARHRFRTHVPAHDFDRLFVRIGVGRTHVHYEAALGRYDVVLRSRLDLRGRHADRSQQRRAAFESITAQPCDVVRSDVEGVDPLVARRMAGAAVRRAVQHYQSAFADGRPHPRRLAHERHVDRPQCGQQRPRAVFAHALLLAREGQQQVERQPRIVIVAEGGREGRDRRAGVVGSQPVEPFALPRRRERVARPRRRGTHRVVVRVEQQRGLRGVEMRRARVDVVVQPLGGDAVRREVARQQIGRARLVARHRRSGHQLFEQCDRLGLQFVQSLHNRLRNRFVNPGSSCRPRRAAPRPA